MLRYFSRRFLWSILNFPPYTYWIWLCFLILSLLLATFESKEASSWRGFCQRLNRFPLAKIFEQFESLNLSSSHSDRKLTKKFRNGLEKSGDEKSTFSKSLLALKTHEGLPSDSWIRAVWNHTFQQTKLRIDISDFRLRIFTKVSDISSKNILRFS